MRYEVNISQEAQMDLKRLLKNEPKAYKKAIQFISELYEHPKTGTGHPEPLKGKDVGAEGSQASIDLFIVFVRQKSTLTCLLPMGIMRISDFCRNNTKR